jgi:hypothetical protein
LAVSIGTRVRRCVNDMAVFSRGKLERAYVALKTMDDGIGRKLRIAEQERCARARQYRDVQTQVHSRISACQNRQKPTPDESSATCYEQSTTNEAREYRFGVRDSIVQVPDIDIVDA